MCFDVKVIAYQAQSALKFIAIKNPRTESSGGDFDYLRRHETGAAQVRGAEQEPPRGEGAVPLRGKPRGRLGAAAQGELTSG